MAVPDAFVRIFANAFGFDAAAGGFTGAMLMLAMQRGVARGIFSNEAGQGSAPIAHAAAQNNDPVDQGVIAMLGTFIDTIMVCTITGLAILTSGVIPQECSAFLIAQSGVTPEVCDTGARITTAAFVEQGQLERRGEAECAADPTPRGSAACAGSSRQGGGEETIARGAGRGQSASH